MRPVRTMMIFLLVAVPVCVRAELPDPMRPAGASASSRAPLRAATTGNRVVPGTFTVQGIFGDARRRIALVDGRLVEAGERIGATSVVEVRSSGVVLRHGSRVWFNPLLPAGRGGTFPADVKTEADR